MGAVLARCAAVVLVGLTLTTARARGDRFTEAKRLMDVGRYSEACSLYAEDLAALPRPGTRFALADCREREGKLLSAWRLFEALALTADAQWQTPARARADALALRLSRLTITIQPENMVTGLVITVDDQPLAGDLWNTAQPIDGGVHRITASAPGARTWSTTLDVDVEGARATLAIPKLPTADQPPAPPRAGSPTALTVDAADGGDVDAAPTPARDRHMPGRVTGLRKVAIGVGVVGVAALAGGTVLGLKARGDQADADAICPTTTCDDDHALALNQAARTNGTRANILFAAGGAAVISATVLWFVGAPAARGGTAFVPTINAHSVGLAMQGGY